jgi:CTP:molybdopterin cytidylyltransferase MocA
VIHWSVEAACASGADEVVVVVGADKLEDLLPDSVTVIDNERWEEGVCSSLLVAVDYAFRKGYRCLAYGFADEPLVSPDHWSRVMRSDGRPVVVTKWGPRLGRPTRLDASVWPLVPTQGDDLDAFVAGLDDNLVSVVEAEPVLVSLDTLADFEKWEAARV